MKKNNNFFDILCKVDSFHWRKDDTDLTTYKAFEKETELLNIAKKHLTFNKVMVQAGGNCGKQLIKFAEYFDTVYTFEPDPVNFHCLVNNLPYDNVIKFQCCLGNDHNMVSLTAFADSIGGFYVNDDPGRIPTIKIDDLNLPACDFLQIDVEGYEFNALQGAKKQFIDTNHLFV